MIVAEQKLNGHKLYKTRYKRREMSKDVNFPKPSEPQQVFIFISKFYGFHTAVMCPTD